MLNIILIWIGSYLLFTVLTAVFLFLINNFFNRQLFYTKAIQISNAGFGVSLMISFMAMMVILQLNIVAEEKSLYLFAVFISAYLLTILIALYAQTKDS